MQPIAVRKSNPTPGDVHVNRPLTNLAVAWQQEQSDYIADLVFPIVPVAKQSDLFFVYSRADWLRAQAEKRGPSTESAGGGYNLTTQSYRADVWAFHKDVSDQVRGNADNPITPDQDAVEFTTQACLTRRETEWAANYFTTGIWGGTDQTGVSGAPAADQFQQFNETGSLPISVIRAQQQAIKAATGFRPNTLVLGSDVWSAIQDNADFIDRINRGQTTGPAMATRQAFGELLEIPRVLVSDAVVNTGPEGGTESTSFALGKSMLLCYSAPSPGIQRPSAGYTFAWTGLLGAGSTGARIKQFRIEKIESDRVECEMAWDQNVVAAELGRFFATAVA